MALNVYQRRAYLWLGPHLQKTGKVHPHLALALQKAHITLRPEVYLAYSYMTIIGVFSASATLILLLAIVAATGLAPLPPTVFVFLVPFPLVLAFVLYLTAHLIPEVRASGRARDIDAKLPYALNYVASMASVGVPPDRIFASLSDQPIYGEVAHEFAWITRDIRILGRDLLTALTAAVDRSPSIKFQDFLQGAVTSLTSGENLKTYFLAKSRQFVIDNRQDQRRFLDNLGVLAESYVTVVVAAPLLLIVLLSVMQMFGGNASDMLRVGYLLILLLLPLAMYAFGASIKYLTPEA